MHKRLLFILSGVLFFSTYSGAQTVREKIDQHAKDPKTRENAAKADVYIADQKGVTDSSRVKLDNDQVKQDHKSKCAARKGRKTESRKARKGDQK